jgi:hypothetical protein
MQFHKYHFLNRNDVKLIQRLKALRGIFFS